MKKKIESIAKNPITWLALGTATAFGALALYARFLDELGSETARQMDSITMPIIEQLTAK